eukprot:6195801-Pleurochrysis_carterae.AAC.3
MHARWFWAGCMLFDLGRDTLITPANACIGLRGGCMRWVGAGCMPRDVRSTKRIDQPVRHLPEGIGCIGSAGGLGACVGSGTTWPVK